MKVCANCFKDEEIKKFIKGTSTATANCDCCGKEADVVDINELLDFLEEFLGLFIPDDNGLDLVSRIQNDWKIFSSNTHAEKIISEVIRICKKNISINDRVSYLNEIKESLYQWDGLKKEVKYDYRYFAEVHGLPWGTLINDDYIVKKGTFLYRARILPDEQKVFNESEMGCPPPDKATPGRANPIGIPYLYLCEDKKTTFYEVRALYLDRVCVGKFKVSKDLNIVDFCNELNLFYTFYNSDISLASIIQRKYFYDKISEELSRPLRRFDTEVEYIPTQLICEYCKHSGADGIRFNSSLRKGGVNITLFKEDSAKCVNTSTYEIKKVEFDYFLLNMA